MPDVRNIGLYEGTDLLLRVTDSINRQRAQRRQLDLQESLQTAQIEQLKDDTGAANINSRANLLNALNESGYIKEVKQDELQKIIPFIGAFETQDKQSRKAEAQKSVEQVKQQGRQTLESQKTAGKKDVENIKIVGRQTVQAQKDAAKKEITQFTETGKNVRQKRSLAQIAALNGITPAEMTAGLQAVDAADPTKANALRAGEDFIVIPGKVFSIGDMTLFEQGKKTITNNDIINKIGEENFTPDLQNALKFFADSMLAAKTQNEKNEQKKQLLEVFPILGRLF